MHTPIITNQKTAELNVQLYEYKRKQEFYLLFIPRPMLISMISVCLNIRNLVLKSVKFSHLNLSTLWVRFSVVSDIDFHI